MARRTQWKIFVLVGMFMLVIYIMSEARKPDRWEWMWAMQSGQNLLEFQGGDEPDTRLRPKPSVVRDADALGTIIAANSQPTDSDDRPIIAPDADGLRNARRDGWSRLFHALDREQQDCLLAALLSVRDQKLVAESDRALLANVVTILDSGWQKYLADASAAVAGDDGKLTKSEKKNWTKLLEQLTADWAEQLPALRHIAMGEQPTTEQSAAMADLQAVLDDVFLEDISDNTVFRPAEQNAWFRMLERLDSMDQAKLESNSTGLVGFLQLYKQPEDYRGRLVTVQGQVRLGYYRQSPRNIYGIRGYYIFWLKPIGSNSPVVVYSLDVPRGFPDVRALEQDSDKPKLSEDVQFTGFFFKRWAYRAEDGTRLAPLLLAKSPKWEPAITVAKSSKMPDWPFFALCIAGTAVFGIAVAVIAYRLSIKPSPTTMYSNSTSQRTPRFDIAAEKQRAEMNVESLRNIASED